MRVGQQLPVQERGGLVKVERESEKGKNGEINERPKE
jgi:hypothetical protein